MPIDPDPDLPLRKRDWLLLLLALPALLLWSWLSRLSGWQRIVLALGVGLLAATTWWCATR